ncbi:MAG: hypothetical protein U1F42_09365 [Candidatus Competibacteraceae bacterium]
MDEVWKERPGDILIFLVRRAEIRERRKAWCKHHPPNTEILPLYARLSAAEQNRVFQPRGRPRIVLATNVAETADRARHPLRHRPRHGAHQPLQPAQPDQRLPVEKISQASANQRAGRCRGG